MSALLKHLLRSALLNIVRRGRRTLIALAAIGFGVVALVIAGGFIGWILSEMRELSIRTWYGHVQVARAGWWEHGAADPAGHRVEGEPAAIAALRRDPRVETVAPRLAFAALVSHGDATLSFLGEGVDPRAEAAFGRSLIFAPGRGDNLVADRIDEAVIGQGLAANLGVGVGDRVVLMANTAAGGVNAVEVRIRGVFLTANKAFDDSTLRVPLALAQRLLRTTGVHSWTVLLRDSSHTEAVAAEVGTRAAAQGLEARPWTALADTFLRTEALFRRQVGAIGIVLALMIVLGITNTMTMSVMERVAEIGTAMALGATRRRVLAQFVVEGAALGVIGGALGVVAGVALAALLSWIGIPLPPPPGLDTPVVAAIRVDASLLGLSFAVAAASTVLASIYPAWRASRLVIVDALRHAHV